MTCAVVNVRNRKKDIICGRITKSSVDGRYGLHRKARSVSRHSNGLGIPSATFHPALPGMIQGVGGDHVDVDDTHCAELEFVEERENCGTRAGGQFTVDACNYKRALSSIYEHWAKDAYKNIQNMGYLNT